MAAPACNALPPVDQMPHMQDLCITEFMPIQQPQPARRCLWQQSAVYGLCVAVQLPAPLAPQGLTSLRATLQMSSQFPGVIFWCTAAD